MKGYTYKKCYLYTFYLLTLLCFGFSVQAQTRFFPPNWFRDMQNDTLEVLVHSPHQNIENVGLVSTKGVEVIESTVFPNAHYASLVLRLKKPPKALQIEVNDETHTYQLHTLEKRKPALFSQADVQYLITPDRFANGDPTNDSLPGFAEHKYGREKPYGRHGGDIQGVIDHLDYIKELGISSLWISPLLVNDQPHESYHGYAITDHYRIDPRFGSNSLYGELVDEMHRRDLKMVKDMVYNHVGTGHFLFTDLPDSSFFNWHRSAEGGFRQTNYRATTVMDPHRSTDDYQQFQDGWFVAHMPDLNQRNPHVSRFLIQNSLWWIAMYGVDAFRIDTYIYPDQAFMAKLSKQVKAQFPGFFIFGETWVHGQPVQSYFVQNMGYNVRNTHMDAVTDFQMYYAFNEAVHNKQSWTGGVAKIYYTLAADYLYDDPTKLVTFLDNHDLARFAGSVNGDYKKLMLGYNWLLTMRGIPCIYYGSEIGMRETENHGLLREDFPGGWSTDSTDAFTPAGRTSWQDSLYTHIHKLLKWRAGSDAIARGKLTQFVPQDNVYVYFRHSEKETVMVIANTGDKMVVHNLARYRELWPKGNVGVHVLTGEEVVGDEMELPGRSSFVVVLRQ